MVVRGGRQLFPLSSSVSPLRAVAGEGEGGRGGRGEGEGGRCVLGDVYCPLCRESEASQGSEVTNGAVNSEQVLLRIIPKKPL